MICVCVCFFLISELVFWVIEVNKYILKKKLEIEIHLPNNFFFSSFTFKTYTKTCLKNQFQNQIYPF